MAGPDASPNRRLAIAAAIVAATTLTMCTGTACARRVVVTKPANSKRSGAPTLHPGRKGPGVDIGFPPVCSGAGDTWPCSWLPVDPDANHTFACALENRMEANMWFQCDGDLFPFSVDRGETVGRAYDDDLRKVSCAWGYAGNFMSGVPAWDGNWPEASSCREDASLNGQCRLVFENREVVLVSGTGGRRVLGSLAVKECNTAWYSRVLPWSKPCIYPNTTHPYIGRIQPSWVAAFFHMDN